MILMTYTPIQREIARFLIKEPHTADELAEILDVPKDKAAEELEGMLTLGVLKKDGAGKYSLIEFITRGVEVRKGMQAEEGEFRLKLMVEGMGRTKDSVERQLKLLEKKLRAEPVKIVSLKCHDVIGEAEHFTGYVEAEISAKSMRELVAIIVAYGPSFVELLYPRKVEMKQSQAQGLLMDVVSAVHYYTALVLDAKGLLPKKPKQEKAPEPIPPEA
jgi:hypothetical protein